MDLQVAILLEILSIAEQKGFVRLRPGIALVVIAPTPERAMASISDMEDPEAFRLSDMAFHKALLESTNNSVAIALHAALIEWGCLTGKSATIRRRFTNGFCVSINRL